MLASMSSAGTALEAIQTALSAVQNNVANASTPGYASRGVILQALPEDIAAGTLGGVRVAGLSNTRDEFAEAAVRAQSAQLAFYKAQSQALSGIAGLFSITGTDGVAGALNGLQQSFSAWSAAPQDPSARQQVLANASALAATIRNLQASLVQASANAGGQADQAVAQINQLAARIAAINAGHVGGTQSDAAVDAQLHDDLAQLSDLTSVTTLTLNDGTTAVLLPNGSPLVMGDRSYNLASASAVPAGAANPQSPPVTQILDSNGADITSAITSGKLGALLDVRNHMLPGLIGDGTTQGSLNQLAQNIADAVNAVLVSGKVSTAAGAAAGSPLFVYNATDPTLAAATLQLNPSITAAQLAPVDSTGVANGNANALSSLATASPGSGPLNGLSWTGFLAGIASSVGSAAQTSQQNEASGQQTIAQTESLRDAISGVSLDAQASTVLQLQKAYDAVARVLTLMNQIADSTLNIIPQA
jgi:flagellar hook-associated protein 1 FlgK